MDVQSLAFRTDLAILGLAGAEVEDQGSRLVVRSPTNPAYYWGNFYLLDRPPAADEVDVLVAAYDADFPDSAHRAFGVDGTGDQRDALAPLVAAGPELDAGTVMTATAVHPPPRPSPDADYRMFVSDEDWVQRVEVAVAVNDEHEPAAYLDFAARKAAHDRSICDAGHGAWWGAFVDGRLASVMGIVDARGGLARYQSVETHPELRGRGLAGTLVHRVGSYALEERGAETLVMVADPDYLAIRIYRSVGFNDTEVQAQLQQHGRGPATPGTSSGHG
ncbi:MAG: GNAT family N-acetyltransferase [Nocardioides sp.]